MACENGDVEVYNFPRADHATVTYTSDGHTDQITCGESSLALNYEIRDMEEYVTNLRGTKFRIYSRCEGCVNSSTESVG